jgi:8-amino-7-oxononanoate synthase
MSLFQRWTDALDELRSQGRYRSFRLPQGHDFTSNDYLGYGNRSTQYSVLSTQPSELSRSGIASRSLRGHHEVWDEVETMLAAWHGAESVLMMTSGFTANEGLISTVAEPGDWVAADELSHACIFEGLRLARPRKFLFRHNDLNHLEDGLKTEAAKRPAGREMFVVTESLFSMDGDLAPLREVVELAERYSAHVIVDEAHSTGCFGPTGSGCVDAAGVRDRVLASMHTGGKALGVPGAYLCGSRLFKEYLTNKCRHLIFTTALPPAVGAWWRERIPQVQGDHEGRERLHRNASRFRESLSRHGLTPPGSTYVVPVIVGADEPSVRASRVLQDAGYDVRAIRPPTVPQGTCRLRISVHADHETPLLESLAGAVAEALAS